MYDYLWERNPNRRSGWYKFGALLASVTILLLGALLFQWLWNASFGAALDADMTYVEALWASILIGLVKAVL